MTKRVRSSEAMARQLSRAQQKNKQRREKCVDSGVDATRVSRLSSEQLESLVMKIGDFTVETHDLEDERFHCHISERPANSSGYPLGVRWNEDDDDGNEWNNRDFRYAMPFVVGQVVMAANGIVSPSKDFDCSHLCGVRMCVRLEHLRWESRFQNNSRNFCSGFAFCGHCTQLACACTHDPKCLKVKK